MARKIPGEFVPLDLNMPRDPAIRRAGPDAELLYIRGLIYLKQIESDGFIPEYDLPVVGVGLKRVEASATALEREGLWLKRPGGWECKSWLKWNASREELDKKREERRLGAIKSNHRQGRHETVDTDCPLCAEAIA